MSVVRLLRLAGTPILQQLKIEEALLRADAQNWLVVNDGSSIPAIVMGISGKAKELIKIPQAQEAKIDVIKRFSGGGTVVVDENTIFSTVIMNSSALPHVECYPRPVMKWTEALLRPVFSPYGNFRLACHDYVYDENKFGGNAQAITKQRWLHHTSFLWDFQEARMALLQHPARVPAYRKGREHLKFLMRLKDIMPLRDAFLGQMEQALTSHGFHLQEASMEEVNAILPKDHLRSTKLIDL
ncbi:hypothetical protein WJX84_006609 [Apatococcus fuscideae]|uniref:BPL/LPL catalytic domain-containing protein n=1 Tax=Apatococcus fuscideae TaxID=2026836 RepID=A0AAW1SVS2_9CHLO